MNVTYPKDDQFDSWLTQVTAACGRYSVTKLGSHSDGAIFMHRRGSLQLAAIDVAETRLKRGHQEVKGDDGKFYFLITQLNGKAAMEQCSHKNVLEVGDLMLLDSTRPCEFSYESSSRQHSLIIPRELMSATILRGQIDSGIRIPASSNMACMARRLVEETIKQPHLDESESEAVLSAVVHLLSPLVAVDSGGASSFQKAFQRATEFIEKNLHLPELNPTMVAEDIGISIRGLYRCFAEHDIVIAKYIRDRRLEVIAELIRRQDNTPLSHLAHVWGFNEPSHFSSTFKARFKMTPSEYREHYSRA